MLPNEKFVQNQVARKGALKFVVRQADVMREVSLFRGCKPVVVSYSREGFSRTCVYEWPKGQSLPQLAEKSHTTEEDGSLVVSDSVNDFYDYCGDNRHNAVTGGAAEPFEVSWIRRESESNTFIVRR